MPDSRPSCFGISEHCMPRDENGIIQPQEHCRHCDHLRECLQEAIDACGGWWAGAGDYLYLVSNGDDNYTVMQGEMHEEKETNDYDYKMVINLSNKLIPRSE